MLAEDVFLRPTTALNLRYHHDHYPYINTICDCRVFVRSCGLGLSYLSRKVGTRDAKHRHSLGLGLGVLLSPGVFLGLHIFLDLGVLLGFGIFLGRNIFLGHGICLCQWRGVCLWFGVCLWLDVLLGLSNFPGLGSFFGDFLGIGNFLGPCGFLGGLGVYSGFDFLVVFIDLIFAPIPQLSRKSAIERLLTWKCDACPGSEIL